MIAGYTAVLCSPEFVCLEEQPGRLDDHALASRLAFFLVELARPTTSCARWPTAGELRPARGAARADRPAARRPEVAAFRRRLPRLLARPAQDRGHRARRPLYPDYYLDDLLTESALRGDAALLRRAAARRPAGAEPRVVRLRDAQRAARRRTTACPRSRAWRCAGWRCRRTACAAA